MQNFKSITDRPLWSPRTAACLAVGLLLAGVAGCGGAVKNATSTPTSSSSVVNYFAPHILSTTQIFTIDRAKGGFYLSTFQLSGDQSGPQVLDQGSYASSKRSLLDLSISTSYAFGGSGDEWVTTSYDPAIAGGYALELADNTGGLMQMTGQPVAPLVAATACPDSTTAQTYWFVSIPGAISTGSGVTPLGGWNPSSDTAYGSVDIAASGSKVTFNNIKQYTLPPPGGAPGKPTYPASSTTGACGSTYSGYLTVIPADYEVQYDANGNPTYPAQASIGIGESGLLVEDNGKAHGTYSTLYENSLGAGTGAIGLPKPSSKLDTSALVAAQFQGFIYAAGIFNQSQGSRIGWSSHPASLGFASTPASCAAVAASTPTMIYGGDYANDNPGASPDGFGNCDFAVDLGSQDDNGLFPSAKVYVGRSYSGNTTGNTYSFPATAIAGQIGGKYAIFLIASDTTSKQAWGVYLLRSN